jgi:hypothetical protein
VPEDGRRGCHGKQASSLLALFLTGKMPVDATVHDTGIDIIQQ